MLEIQDAEHEETTPGASRLIITKLTCSLVGQSQRINITPGTLAHEAYGKEEVIEQFQCNYGLNPRYRDSIIQGGLNIVGVDPDGEARVIELPDHRFFMATLFVPQLSSQPEIPHPLILAFLKAAVDYQTSL
ncbi:MAG: hypothetical protein GTO13_15780 [Proteobacteria bacterium]|nr:hypothetical protein [Pseudomonadota bacterium]